MKAEKDNAMDRADTCEQQSRDANLRAEKVQSKTFFLPDEKGNDNICVSRSIHVPSPIDLKSTGNESSSPRKRYALSRKRCSSWRMTWIRPRKIFWPPTPSWKRKTKPSKPWVLSIKYYVSLPLSHNEISPWWKRKGHLNEKGGNLKKLPEFLSFCSFCDGRTPPSGRILNRDRRKRERH